MFDYERRLKTNARRLRSEMTDAEIFLWTKLRAKQVHGVQFYRQKPVGPYIVDFYSATARLVIELDGSQHFEAQGRVDDAARNAELARRGLIVLRFDNHAVIDNLDGVLDAIGEAVALRVGGGA